MKAGSICQDNIQPIPASHDSGAGMAAASLPSHWTSGYEGRQQLEVVSDGIFLVARLAVMLPVDHRRASLPAKVNDRPDNEQKASSRKGLSSVAVIELVPISIQPHHIIPLFLCSQIALVHSGCSSLVCCWGHFNLIHFINASQYFFIPYPEQRLRMCVPVFPGDLTARGRPPRSLWRVKKRAATWRQCADTPGPPQTAA